jgi:cytochrome c biogenesis protein CcmG/thiol:disulfide interchange protein DsbE
MKRIWLFLPLVLAIALGVILFAGLGNDPTRLDSARIGEPVPDFELALLAEPDKKVGPEVLRGETILLNIWATWCPTCRAEHDYFETLQAKGIPIVGVNYKNERDLALEWLDNLGNPYRFNLFDPEGTLGFDLGVYGAPETYVIDAEGIVRYRFVGAVDQKVWEEELEPVYRRYSGEEG